ncbi:MAG TPA: double-strand break repair protein AddB [Rhizomicrobium sp.]|nr:double-strand break repair protein AddB [Rhizomicrobium sp.]
MIPASAPFAETLARGLVVRTGADSDPLSLANLTIFLPTRRAARTLSETFARVLGGAALLPSVQPLGDADEDEFLFDLSAGQLTLPPAISPIRRVLLLATMVQHWDQQRRDGRMSFAQAVAFARPLASFLDEVETQGANLDDVQNLAEGNLAQHWDQVKEFLLLLRNHWPKLLEAERAMNPAARRNLALRAIASRLRKHPPPGLIVAAGSTGSIPATAELLSTIARLPNGLIVLPGLDTDLDEASWSNLDAGHPQFGMKQLLQRIDVLRADVANFEPVSRMTARERVLREVLRPAPTTDAWRAIAERGAEEIADGLRGLSLVEAAQPAEEAATIALILRESLDTPECRAALVTPDRPLARRVAAELGRWNIAIDDSAGRPLANTSPGAFLCLFAEAAAAKFAPVPLLALLKHPLAAGGQKPADFRRRVRQLDRLCLRGPRPNPGLAGIRAAITAALREAHERDRRYEIERIAEVAYWFQALSRILEPLGDAFANPRASISEILGAHVTAAEALASTDAERGDSSLWRGDAGEAATRFIFELEQAVDALPQIESSSYPILFRALAEERAVRPSYGPHPRLAILGPLEARLQSFDVLVLGGLNEGTWPSSTAADPWLSRPMRVQLGLESPERRIGLAAHDFAMLAATPRVILTRSQKVDGSPTVASRWVQRLEQFAMGLGIAAGLKSEVPYAEFAGRRDEPPAAPKRMARPSPRPPVAARPRSLSVTEIESWLRDPYAIYAKHVLRLSPLDPLDAEIGPLERGSAIHKALEIFVKEFGDNLPPDAELKLIQIADDVFAAANLPRAALALWRPRFLKAARWFVTEEHVRRPQILRSHLEIKGQRRFAGPGGEFILRGRADRVDLLRGGRAVIIDYKTGRLPSGSQVKVLLSPQLPLEGAILAGGGFPDIEAIAGAGLMYIRFGGGNEPGEVRAIPDAPALIVKAEEKLRERVDDFDDETTPYWPRLIPYRADEPGEYDHLSRVREWSFIGWEEAEE